MSIGFLCDDLQQHTMDDGDDDKLDEVLELEDHDEE
jgi:hypothetical protein